MAAATILCRFLDGDGQEFVGQPTATDAETGLPTEVQLLAEQNIFGDLALGEEKKAVSKVLAPLDPKAILCIGLNYAKHAAESGMAVPKNPVLFMKTVSTLNHPGDPIGAPPPPAPTPTSSLNAAAFQPDIPNFLHVQTCPRSNPSQTGKWSLPLSLGRLPRTCLKRRHSSMYWVTRAPTTYLGANGKSVRLFLLHAPYFSVLTRVGIAAQSAIV